MFDRNITSPVERALADNAHWLLRSALVGVFGYHGILKFMDLNGFSAMLSLSITEVSLVALAQVTGSGLLIIGGLRRDGIFDVATRVGAALNLPVMIGAIVLVHWGRWNFVPSETHPLGGMEFQVVLALVMLYLVITGNRAFSVVTSDSTPSNAAAIPSLASQAI